MTPEEREMREKARAEIIANCDQIRPILEQIIAGDDAKRAKRARRTLLNVERMRARMSGDYSRLRALREQMRQEQQEQQEQHDRWNT